MHACLLHIYDHALLHLSFIVIYTRGSVMTFVYVQFYPIKRSIYRHAYIIRSAMFFLHFKAPEWFLVCWQIASYSYMSSHLAL
jgi:hypothetical protein